MVRRDIEIELCWLSYANKNIQDVDAKIAAVNQLQLFCESHSAVRKIKGYGFIL